jgi:hypothetical protein
MQSPIPIKWFLLMTSMLSLTPLASSAQEPKCTDSQVTATTESLHIPIQRELLGYHVLDLDASLVTAAAGRPIASLTVRMALRGGRGAAALAVDDITLGGWTLLDYQLSDYCYELPASGDGRLPHIELRTSGGNILVDSITVQFR